MQPKSSTTVLYIYSYNINNTGLYLLTHCIGDSIFTCWLREGKGGEGRNKDSMSLWHQLRPYLGISAQQVTHIWYTISLDNTQHRISGDKNIEVTIVLPLFDSLQICEENQIKLSAESQRLLSPEQPVPPRASWPVPGPDSLKISQLHPYSVNQIGNLYLDIIHGFRLFKLYNKWQPIIALNKKIQRVSPYTEGY